MNILSAGCSVYDGLAASVALNLQWPISAMGSIIAILSCCRFRGLNRAGFAGGSNS